MTLKNLLITWAVCLIVSIPLGPDLFATVLVLPLLVGIFLCTYLGHLEFPTKTPSEAFWLTLTQGYRGLWKFFIGNPRQRKLRDRHRDRDWTK